MALGTIYDLHTAKRWLTSTFLYVRLAQNPDNYKLDMDVSANSLDEKIEQMCKRDIKLLQETELLTSESRLKCTEPGDAMARYYVNFKTMKVILGLPPKAKMSEIVSCCGVFPSPPL